MTENADLVDTDEPVKETDSQKVKRLISEIDWSQTPEKVVDYITWSSVFTDYSLFNKVLIRVQMPEATRVAANGKWNKMGRKIIAGETHRIRIYRPKRKRFYLDDDADERKYRNVQRYTNKDGKEVRYIEWTEYGSFAVFDISQTEPFEEGGGQLPDLVPDYLNGEELEASREEILRISSNILDEVFQTQLDRQNWVMDPVTEEGAILSADRFGKEYVMLNSIHPARSTFDCLHLVLRKLYPMYGQAEDEVGMRWTSTLIAAAMVAVESGWDVTEMTENILRVAADRDDRVRQALIGSKALDVVKTADWLKGAFTMARDGVPTDWIAATG